MKTLNVELIKQLKIRILLIVIFLTSTIFILTFNLSAQEKEKERGYKGRINKNTMLSIFSRSETVRGYVIKGDDLIEIIEKTDLEIRIENSIIEGGLDFTKLAVPLEKEYLPKDWDEKEKEAFINKYSPSLENIQIVKNEILIENSEIKSNIKSDYSIIAFDTIFSGYVSFVLCNFSGDVDFNSSNFIDNAQFIDSNFSGDADFSESSFSDGANFSYCNFSDMAIFDDATFGDWATFSRAKFSDTADFSYCNFNDGADFMYSNFSGETNFILSNFIGNAFFVRSNFSGDADFSESSFSDGADFMVSSFSGKANFEWVKFNDRAIFYKATFSDEASFLWAVFNKLAYFNGVRFFDRLNVLYVVFKEYADFRESKIRKLNYNSAAIPTILEGRIDFRSAIITEAHFQDIIFEKDVDFSDVRFGIPIIIVKLEKLPQGLEFPNSLKDKIHYEVRAKLLTFTGVMTKSEKEELTGLSEDSQYREAIEQLFRESTLGPFAVIFKFVKFESDAYFLRTKFSGDTALESVTFKKEANFTDAEFKGKKEDGKHNFSLSYLNFKNLLIKWGQLPNPKSWVRGTRIKSFIDIEKEERNEKKSKQERKDEEVDEVKKKGEEKVESGEGQPLSQVLKGLEASFRNQNQLSDANKAYYYKKKAEFKEERKRHRKAFWKWFPKQALWSLWWISCGYGTKILWILGWCIFFDLFFAMIYSFKKNLKKKIHPETERKFEFKQRFLDFPRLYLKDTKPLDMIKSKSVIKFINALRFSSVILLKVGYRDTTISGKILGVDCKYIVWFEWLLGFYLLACLTVTMSNTIPIINRLISGIF